MERWKDKVAVVTGASKGIGKTIAKALVDHGLKVVGLARNIECMVPIDQKFYPVQADVRREEDIVKAFTWTLDTLGPIHILVNNAGIYQVGSMLDDDSNLWKNVIDTNVMGLCMATREAVKQMKSHQIDGHIIHINSLAGHKVITVPPGNMYPPSKFAVTALTMTLHQELNSIQSKIKITSISPGVTRTETSQDVVKFSPEVTLLESEDVSDAVCYVLGTPPHVQIHEMIIHPMNDCYF